MHVQNAAIDTIAERIMDVCLLLPEVRTKLTAVRTLTARELFAVYVVPEGATRRLIAQRTMEITRNYRLWLICTKAVGKSDAQEIEAVRAVYPYEHLLPNHFAKRKRLQLNGNDGIVFATKLMEDNGPKLTPIPGNSEQFGVWDYVLPVVTTEDF